MPELPEVESVRVALEAPLRGRRIEGVRLPDERCAAHPAAEAFCDSLRGREFSALGRRGKFLYAALDDGGKLVVHLRMTGLLLLAEAGEASAAHTRAAFLLDDGRELRFVDSRRFGRLWLLRPGEEDTYTGMAGLGPEPDDPALDAAYLRSACGRSRRAVKACLLDHSPSENECFQTVFYVNDQNRARSDPKSRKKEGAPPQNSAIFLILGIAVLR